MEPAVFADRNRAMGSFVALLKDTLREVRRALFRRPKPVLHVPVFDRTPQGWGFFRRPARAMLLDVRVELWQLGDDDFTRAARRSRSRPRPDGP